MKLETPIRELSTIPSDELLNYDYNSITLHKISYNDPQIDFIFEGSIVFPFIITPFGIDKLNLSENQKIFKNQDCPLFNLAISEIKKIEKELDATVKIATLSGIEPGGRIHKHFDTSPIFQMCHRVHIPLVTSRDAIFTIDDMEYFLEKGKCYEFDNTRYHSVFNNSKEARIHLLIDLLPNNFVGTE